MNTVEATRLKSQPTLKVELLTHVTLPIRFQHTLVQITVQLTRPLSSAYPRGGALGARDLDYKISAYPGLTA